MPPCDILQITVISQIGAVQQLHDIHMAVMHNILDSIGHIVTKGEGVLHLITPSMQLLNFLNSEIYHQTLLEALICFYLVVQLPHRLTFINPRI